MSGRGRAGGPWAAARWLALAGLVVLLGVDCHSPTSPEGKGEADISVSNDYGQPLDISLDGAFQFQLPWKATIEIDDVDLFHEYRLDARDPATGELIDTTLVDVQENSEYAWTITPAPRLMIVNNWSEALGEKLAIFLDGVFQFTLERGETRMIMKLEFGERYLEAVDLNTGRTVMSWSLKVEDNDTYEWDIKKITGS